MRKIYLSGEINEESFKEFSEQLDEMALESSKDIEIELNSIGGNALDAIAFLSKIRLSRCDITVTVYGIAGSAAVMILAAGDNRRMTKESWVMVHEDSGSYEDIKSSELSKQAMIADTLENQWCSLLEECTGTSKEKWASLHKSGDLYLTPTYCLSLNLIGSII